MIGLLKKLFGGKPAEQTAEAPYKVETVVEAAPLPAVDAVVVAPAAVIEQAPAKKPAPKKPAAKKQQFAKKPAAPKTTAPKPKAPRKPKAPVSKG